MGNEGIVERVRRGSNRVSEESFGELEQVSTVHTLLWTSDGRLMRDYGRSG